MVSNGILAGSPGGFIGKKITVSHDGTTTLIENGGFNRTSHDKSFKYSSEKKHHRSRQVANMSKTHGPGGGSGWAGNIVRAEHSPSNQYLLRQHSEDSEAASEHVYLDVLQQGKEELHVLSTDGKVLMAPHVLTEEYRR